MLGIEPGTGGKVSPIAVIIIALSAQLTCSVQVWMEEQDMLDVVGMEAGDRRSLFKSPEHWN